MVPILLLGSLEEPMSEPEFDFTTIVTVAGKEGRLLLSPYLKTPN
jgi:hypothetical protein